MNRFEWNSRMVEVLDNTFSYDSTMTELIMPEIAKRHTTPSEQNENYRARLLNYRSDLEEKRRRKT